MEETSAAVSSRSFIEETTNPKMQQLIFSARTLTPLPTLTFDLIAEILCRLPVKLLLQLQCLSKSYKSLISDSKFVKKHLSLSTMCHLHEITESIAPHRYNLTSYPFHSVFTEDLSTNVTHFEYSSSKFGKPRIVDSCNGILCITNCDNVLLWNPSIRKLKELPLLQKPQGIYGIDITVGFGYDSFTDNYKVVVFVEYLIYDGMFVHKKEAKVHRLGTNSWKSIQECPFGLVSRKQPGKFVSHKIHWLATVDARLKSPSFIVSFDLGKESYQKILAPDYVVVDVLNSTLSVLRNCLCIMSGHDIWVMKEYGIQESWTKLFTISNMPGPAKSYYFTKAIYAFEDDQVLLEYVGNQKKNVGVYDSKNGTFKFTMFQSTQEISVESLISPCF